jgi:hypothetical protein
MPAMGLSLRHCARMTDVEWGGADANPPGVPRRVDGLLEQG